jgi:hypothetical protein
MPVGLADSLGVAAPVEQALSENRASVAPITAIDDFKLDKKILPIWGGRFEIPE